jgi:hypothetical protein
MKLIAIALCLMLTACAGVAPAQQAPTPSQPQPAAAQPPAEAKINLPEKLNLTIPNWPVIGYISEDNESFMLLVVKDPSKFPVPKSMAFKRRDGSVIEMPMMKPDREAPK